MLAGETEAFPLLHHWRVLPGRAPVAAEHLDIDATVAQLGGSPAVRARLDELARAAYSLVLFFEHLPRSLGDWLGQDPVGRAGSVERQLAGITAFLRERELLHMDGHFGNMRADDERVYLTDFGLVTSPRFALSADERAFVARHAGHDAGYAATQLVNWLVSAVCGIAEPGPRNEFVRRCAAGDIPPDVPTPVAEVLARNACAATRMNDLYWRLFDGDIEATL
ncbi:hypothetical protein O7635_01590 [Asanoa sp. WMMD1127]|uniref:hypothetical protein n=1 Tax=Asanoa sp. WMMD1127 TaxID=3016107 RepID=UPI0024168A4A|nr:hypothetical protein [Asanoa sp. WMMD1127]MDG4820545.1 hypothetical protein [Asanoa sp. WMMD1127]